MKNYKLFSTLDENYDSPTKASVSPAALLHNYRTLCDISGRAPDNPGNICVVKADAYGHLCEICAPALAGAGCRRFAVSSIAEAAALRGILDENGFPDSEILILGYTPTECADMLIKYRVTQCVFSERYANALNSALTGKINVHIKLDTGMNRIGFKAQSEEDVAAAADAILGVASLDNLKITGMFTHFARADEGTAEGDNFTREQFLRFTAVDASLRAGGLEIPFRHVCNSAGATRFPAMALEGVRFGIKLYGYEENATGLIPVMTLETRISHIHELNAGESVGYGSTFTATRPTRLATLPIGYADGFIRAYSGAYVAVMTSGGKTEAPIVGRICMDQCMIDVTGCPAEVGDRVVLFGDRPERLYELSRRSKSITYEALCLISSRVPVVKGD